MKSIDNETVRQIAYLGLSEEIIRQLNAMTEQVFEDEILILNMLRHQLDFTDCRLSVMSSYCVFVMAATFLSVYPHHIN